MFVNVENMAGIQPIGVVSATQIHPGGKIIRAYDPIYGEGEFMYLQGVASTIVGSLVTWAGVSGSNAPTWQTALVPNTANQGVPLAFASAALLATQWGWYQITGVAIAATNGTFTAAGPVFISATAGQVSSTVQTGRQLLNAQALTANNVPGTNQVLVSINGPFAQGQIT